MKTFKSLAIAVSGLCALPVVAHGKEIKNDTPTGMAMMRLNGAELSEHSQQKQQTVYNNTASSYTPVQQIYGGNVWNNLKNDFRMREVHPALVRNHEHKFIANSSYFNRTINRSKPYMFHIANEVKKRGMPAEIALLPFIESAYVTKASSHVGASGLWQFMPATGRHYGLEQTPLYDGRHDVYASTDAALNYLQYLHDLFGDWSLALAAYNWGEGNVSRAVRQAQAAGIAPTYENLRMPKETRNYVPKLLAVRNLVSNPQVYGLELPEIQNSPYFTAVNVDTPMDIMAAAHLANISESEFLALNPAFKTPVFIPKNGRKMLLPITAAKTFETNYRNSDSKALLSWDVFTPTYNMNLSDIAMQTNTPLTELRRLNGLNGTKISAGRSILVSRNLNAAPQGIKLNFAKADNDPTPDTFVEQPPVLNLAGSLSSYQHNTQSTEPVQKQGAFINFVENSKARYDNSNAVNHNRIETVAKVDVHIDKKIADAKPKPDLTFKIETVNFGQAENVQQAKNNITKQQSNNILETALNTKIAASGTDTVDNAISSVNNHDVNQISLAETDPLLSLAHERQRALQNVRQSVAQINREELAKEKAAEKAAKLAEAKEAQRRKQEQLRAERLQQAQQLAMIRQARENSNNSMPVVAQAIRTSALISSNTGTHKVAEGDTLYNIAQRYNLNVADLISANNIHNNNIRIGQVLKLTAKKNMIPARDALRKVSANSANVLSVSAAPASYTVRKGDTLHSIASRYNLNVNDIKRLNNGNANVKTGQTIKLISS